MVKKSKVLKSATKLHGSILGPGVLPKTHALLRSHEHVFGTNLELEICCSEVLATLPLIGGLSYRFKESLNQQWELEFVAIQSLRTTQSRLSFICMCPMIIGTESLQKHSCVSYTKHTEITRSGSHVGTDPSTQSKAS